MQDGIAAAQRVESRGTFGGGAVDDFVEDGRDTRQTFGGGRIDHDKPASRSWRSRALATRNSRSIVRSETQGRRGDGQEVCAILTGDIGVDQAQIRFVNQCPGLERVAGAFAAHRAPGHAGQFLVQERQQAIERRAVAGAP